MSVENDGLLAVAAAIIGAVLRDVVGRVLPTGDKKIDAEATFRSQLMARLQTTEEQLLELREEIERWKGMYYTLLVENERLQTQQAALAEEVERLRRAVPTEYGASPEDEPEAV